jgi:hypothetical protein
MLARSAGNLIGQGDAILSTSGLFQKHKETCVEFEKEIEKSLVIVFEKENSGHG